MILEEAPLAHLRVVNHPPGSSRDRHVSYDARDQTRRRHGNSGASRSVRFHPPRVDLLKQFLREGTPLSSPGQEAAGYFFVGTGEALYEQTVTSDPAGCWKNRREARVEQKRGRSQIRSDTLDDGYEIRIRNTDTWDVGIWELGIQAEIRIRIRSRTTVQAIGK